MGGNDYLFSYRTTVLLSFLFCDHVPFKSFKNNGPSFQRVTLKPTGTAGTTGTPQAYKKHTTGTPQAPRQYVIKDTFVIT